MVQFASNQRWPITAEDRQNVVDAVLSIATTPGDERVQLAAARVVIAMMAQNQKDDHHEPADGKEENRVLSLLDSLQKQREPSAQ